MTALILSAIHAVSNLDPELIAAAALYAAALWLAIAPIHRI